MRSGISKVSERGTYGLGKLLEGVERLLLAALAVDQYLGMPPGREERGPGHRPGDHRVDRSRGAVDQHLAARQQLLAASSRTARRRCRPRRAPPRSGSCGVVGALNWCSFPASSSTARSVKVPPVSIANRIRRLLRQQRCAAPIRAPPSRSHRCLRPARADQPLLVLARAAFSRIAPPTTNQTPTSGSAHAPGPVGSGTNDFHSTYRTTPPATTGMIACLKTLNSLASLGKVVLDNTGAGETHR